MPVSSAASSTERPAKYRSRTSWAAAASSPASFWIASSMTSSSSGPAWVTRCALCRSTPGRPPGPGRGDEVRAAQVPALQAPAPLLAVLVAGVVDEDAAHGLGRGGEEVPATVPAPGLVGVHQAQVGLVHQGGGLERLAGRLP